MPKKAIDNFLIVLVPLKKSCARALCFFGGISIMFFSSGVVFFLAFLASLASIASLALVWHFSFFLNSFSFKSLVSKTSYPLENFFSGGVN